jgi:hypothetical protein
LELAATGRKSEVLKTYPMEYPWVFKVYTIGVPIGHQGLYYSGIHKASSSMLEEYPQVLKGYPIGVLMGVQGLHYKSTQRSSRAIL